MKNLASGIWSIIYDEEKNIRQGKYEKYSKSRDGGGSTVRVFSGILHVSIEFLNKDLSLIHI